LWNEEGSREARRRDEGSFSTGRVKRKTAWVGDLGGSEKRKQVREEPEKIAAERPREVSFRRGGKRVAREAEKTME